MNEAEIRELMVLYGKSLFDRGYTAGGSGNMSVKTDEGILISPTGSSMGGLLPEKVSKFDRHGDHLSGDKPSKEYPLHLAVYQARPQAGAVVHLHSPCAVALSCLKGIDPSDVLPPLTPYFVLRIGKLPLVPYFPPGHSTLAEAVSQVLQEHRAMLLAHHGSVVTGKDLKDAVHSAEELEETARVFLMLKDSDFRVLNNRQVAELKQKVEKS